MGILIIAMLCRCCSGVGTGEGSSSEYILSGIDIIDKFDIDCELHYLFGQAIT
jgi:hypothetical protein